MQASERLGPLCEDVVFLGGATVGLLLTDPAVTGSRITRDVDVIFEISGRVTDVYDFDAKLLERGFRNDITGPVCRYVVEDMILDVIPVHPANPGEVNNWYPYAVQSAIPCTLPNGLRINLISAPCFLGTKLVAFRAPSREHANDLFLSRDFEDIVRLVDGRAEIVSEVAATAPELRRYIIGELRLLLGEPYLEEAIIAHVSPEREFIVLERLTEVVG